MPKFTVDTHLFRELGELLVGRDSTALVELIKNAYDADATEVTVNGEHLNNPNRGRILVTDNGIGMNADQFENGFLRVASRLKDQGKRRSTQFHRRYTGSKGIGRLAAHKLARKLEINSVRRISESEGPGKALYAAIDWDDIERHETLDELDSTDAIRLETKTVHENARSGTTLVLSRLRRAWSPVERARFFAEVQSFDPPAFLCNSLPRSVIEEPLLFDTPVVRDEVADHQVAGSPFRVQLEGDLVAGEDYWGLVAEVATWVLEIRAVPGSDHVRFAIAPTKRTRKDNPEARELEQSIPHPTPMRGPHFDARILVREGRFGDSQDQRVWATHASGIRVYLEGFRILPYGEHKDDWLSIDADYTRRPRQLEMLQKLRPGAEGTDLDEGLIRVPNNNYFGAVFLTQERCPNLRVLVNREGFIPETGFDTLMRLVRTGIDLCTRARAAATYLRRQQRKEDRRGESRAVRDQKGRVESGGATDEAVEKLALPDRLRDAVQFMNRVRSRLNEGDTTRAEVAVMRKLGETTELAVDLWSEHSLLHVLAAVGTQMAAFVHEINALLGAAQTIEHSLERVLEEDGLSREQRRRLRQTLTVATDLKRGLERQAAYLMDIETPDARRRRSRQRLGERFAVAVRLVRHQAERRGIDIDNRIPPELRSPPMFPAELTAVFANLLTNAVKAAGEDGRIRATASIGDDQVRIRIQNTGAAVRLDEAERWFKPFQSTTSEVNAVLGQGMGLGLTITRNLLETYGAFVTFVRPTNPFATAVEIAMPSRSQP